MTATDQKKCTRWDFLLLELVLTGPDSSNLQTVSSPTSNLCLRWQKSHRATLRTKLIQIRKVISEGKMENQMSISPDKESTSPTGFKAFFKGNPSAEVALTCSDCRANISVPLFLHDHFKPYSTLSISQHFVKENGMKMMRLLLILSVKTTTKKSELCTVFVLCSIS